MENSIQNINTDSKSSNQSLITVIGGIILTIVIFIAGFIGIFVNSTKSDTCVGMDQITGTQMNGYKDSNGVCKSIDGKELK